MTPQTRQQLLALVDALCEGVASEADCARLEQLVLQNPEACALYVRAIGLHGTLHWDAAGVGDLEQVLEFELAAEFSASEEMSRGVTGRSKSSVAPSSERPIRRLVAWLTALSTCLCISLFGWSLLQPRGESSGSPLVSSNSPELEPENDPPRLRLPQVTMPGRTTSAVHDPVVSAVIDPPQIAVPQRSLVSLINDEISEGWLASGVQATQVASDAEWLRRVYLDLAGRIPTLMEAESFLRDTSVDKRERQLTRLLNGEEFPAQLAMVWTNLLVGRTPQAKINRAALEQYLANQFAANRPWSETVTDLITAQGSGDTNGAANFLLAHLNNEAVPATAITSRVLLGHQMQCTQCHQHPAVAGWGQEQFWEVNACFQQTRVVERTLVDQETGERQLIRELTDVPGTAGSYYETLQGVVKVAYPGFNGHEISMEPNTLRRHALAELMTTGEETDVARAFVNRTWAHFFGYGFSSPVDDLGPHTAVSHPELLQELTRRFVDGGYNVRELVTAICQSEAYQLSSTAGDMTDNPDQGELPLFSRGYVKPMSPEQMFHSLLIASGAPPAELRRSGKTAARKSEWLAQFFKPEETEENGESSSFDGSLQKTLSLMNGDLVRDVVQAESGTFVAGLVDNNDSDVEKIRHLCLATLSRHPTNEELNSIRQVLRSYVRQRVDRNVAPKVAVSEGYRDLYWAYLNSSEFAVVP